MFFVSFQGFVLKNVESKQVAFDLKDLKEIDPITKVVPRKNETFIDLIRTLAESVFKNGRMHLRIKTYSSMNENKKHNKDVKLDRYKITNY